MWHRDRVLAIVIVLFGLYITYVSVFVLGIGSIHYPDSGFLTVFIGLAFVILGGTWALSGPAPRKPAGKFIEKGKIIKPVAAVLVMVLYAATFKGLGYITSTLIFVVAWEKIIERQNWLNTILISILSTAGMYLLFGILLQAPLPGEIFLR